MEKGNFDAGGQKAPKIVEQRILDDDVREQEETRGNRLSDEDATYLVQESMRFREKEKLEAPGRIKDHIDHIRFVEKAYSEQLGRLEKRGQSISRGEFELYETEIADAWKGIEREEWKGGIVRTEENLAEVEASFVHYMGREKSSYYSSIEAQAGLFYDFRKSELQQAIRNSDSAEKEQDEQCFNNFIAAVWEHLSYRYRDQMRDPLADPVSGDARRIAHNKVITQLNNLNSLANKYHTKPFTPRNFWKTSAVRTQTPRMSDRMYIDRYTVQAYYDLAFRSEIEKDAKAMGVDKGLLFKG